MAISRGLRNASKTAETSDAVDWEHAGINVRRDAREPARASAAGTDSGSPARYRSYRRSASSSHACATSASLPAGCSSSTLANSRWANSARSGAVRSAPRFEFVNSQRSQRHSALLARTLLDSLRLDNDQRIHGKTFVQARCRPFDVGPGSDDSLPRWQLIGAR